MRSSYVILALAATLGIAIYTTYLAVNYASAYGEMRTKYNELYIAYNEVLRRLEMMNTSSSMVGVSQGIHRHTLMSGLAINGTLDLSLCNGYSIQHARSLSFRSTGAGYLLVNYTVSEPKIYVGTNYAYYVYVMAKAIPSIPLTAIYIESTYAYTGGRVGQLIIPVLPNMNYTITLGFTCYGAQYYPYVPYTTGSTMEEAVVSIVYVW